MSNRTFETYFLIKCFDNTEIKARLVSIYEDSYPQIDTIDYFDINGGTVKVIPKKDVKSIFLMVFGPMNSFGSNCGEIKERIYGNKD